MAKREYYDLLWSRYQKEGMPNKISIERFCVSNRFSYREFEKWYKQIRCNSFALIQVTGASLDVAVGKKSSKDVIAIDEPVADIDRGQEEHDFDGTNPPDNLDSVVEPAAAKNEPPSKPGKQRINHSSEMKRKIPMTILLCFLVFWPLNNNNKLRAINFKSRLRLYNGVMLDIKRLHK